MKLRKFPTKFALIFYNFFVFLINMNKHKNGKLFQSSKQFTFLPFKIVKFLKSLSRQDLQM